MFRKKTDTPVPKMRVWDRSVACYRDGYFCGARPGGMPERQADLDDNESLPEQQMPRLRALYLYRCHALRPLPLRSPARVSKPRRTWESA